MGFSTIGGAGGGSAETPSGGAGSEGHTGVEDNSSSNADQIQINDGSVVINKDNDDCDFIVESENSALMFKVDAANDTVSVGCNAVEAASNNPSALLVVSNRSTASTPATYSPLVVEYDDAASYINIISEDNGTGSYTGLKLGDSSDPDEAGLVYNAVNKRMYISGNAQASTTAASISIAHSTKSVMIGDSAVPPASGLEIAKAAANAELTISAYHDTEATTPKITLRKADNTVASPALVDDNAVLGTVSYQGHDGSGWHEGARIEARTMGTPSDGADMPTELSFWTTSNAAGTPSQRMTISENGSLGVGSTAPTAAVQIYRDLNAADDLGDFDNYHLVLQGGNATNDTVGILLSSASDTYGGSSIVHFDTAGGGQGDLAFFTKQGTGAAAPTEVLRLKDDGRSISDFTASAWVNIDGENATPAARDSHNVSSITDRAQGKLTVNFTVNMGNDDYAAVVGAHAPATSGELSLGTAHDLAVGSVQVDNRYTHDNTWQDADFYLVCFGGN